MTLILSLATPEFVVQISDRRLTYRDGKGFIRVADDDANKLTVFRGQMAFGFTGLAHIGSQRTDTWLARALASLDAHGGETG
jgi:hypothetical protein